MNSDWRARPRPFALLVVAVVLLGFLILAGQAEAYVYWVNPTGDTIARANLDGSGVNENFISGAVQPNSLAISAGYIYWANAGSGSIGRANIDGTGVNENFISGLTDDIEAVAVDDQHIYWDIDTTGGTIGRANLDGTGVDTNFITGLFLPDGLAVDGEHIYWTEGASAVARANLDGTSVNLNFIPGLRYADGVAVTPQYLYWTNGGDIGRANLDGTGVDQTLVSGQVDLRGVAVDEQHLYWLDHDTGAVGRANLDGTVSEPAFIANAFVPDLSSFGSTGLAVDSGPPGTASANVSTVNFAGAQPVGVFSAPASVEIQNTGHGDLELQQAKILGADPDDFLISFDTCSDSTLVVGGGCEIHVRFVPSAVGRRTAALALETSNSASPISVALTGTGASFPGSSQTLTSIRKVELLKCRTTVGPALEHRGRTRSSGLTTCAGRLVSGTIVVTGTGASSRARIFRGARTYARGTSIPTGRRSFTIVTSQRQLIHRGTYRLSLRAKHNHESITRTATITIR